MPWVSGGEGYDTGGHVFQWYDTPHVPHGWEAGVLYDAATKTLFTSDMYTHTWREGAEGPWIIQDGDDDPTDFDHVRSFLLNTRYWWLEGVDTAKLRKGMNAILDKHDIETIAPGYGCVLRGRKTVEKHIKLVDDVLKSLDKSVATSRYVSRDEER
jgi:flavorubredoxin